MGDEGITPALMVLPAWTSAFQVVSMAAILNDRRYESTSPASDYFQFTFGPLFNHFQRTRIDGAFVSVERYCIAFVQNPRTDPATAAGQIDFEIRASHEAHLSKLAGDHGGVRGAGPSGS